METLGDKLIEVRFWIGGWGCSVVRGKVGLAEKGKMVHGVRAKDFSRADKSKHASQERTGPVYLW